MKETASPKLTVISNPERIKRIIDRVCAANVTVLIEVMSGQHKITLKGIAFSLESSEKKDGIFVINNISKTALSYLKKNQIVQGEFVLLSSKIQFRSEIIGIAADVVFLSIPSKMEAAERRKNLRHKTSKEFHPYFDVNSDLFEHQLPDKEKDELSLKQIDHFEHYDTVKNYVRVCDISADGLCLISYFPFLPQWIKLSSGLLEGRIIFPMQKPTMLILSVKWQKQGKMEDDVYPAYRVGCSYLEKSDELTEQIKIFIHQLNQHAAI